MLTGPQLQCLVGKASWDWDWELGLHIPVCSGWKMSPTGNVVRCANGPLDESEYKEGVCSEGPHLIPSTISPRVDAQTGRC